MPKNKKHGRPPAVAPAGYSTIADAAEQAGVSYAVAYRRVRAGLAAHVQLENGTICVLAADVPKLRTPRKPQAASPSVTIRVDRETHRRWSGAARAAKLTLPRWVEQRALAGRGADPRARGHEVTAVGDVLHEVDFVGDYHGHGYMIVSHTVTKTTKNFVDLKALRYGDRAANFGLEKRVRRSEIGTHYHPTPRHAWLALARRKELEIRDLELEISNKRALQHEAISHAEALGPEVEG